jgi:hypothetical protein
MVEPDMAPNVAVIIEDPGLTAMVMPFAPALLRTEATVGADELHVTDVVRSSVKLSL